MTDIYIDLLNNLLVKHPATLLFLTNKLSASYKEDEVKKALGELTAKGIITNKAILYDFQNRGRVEEYLNFHNKELIYASAMELKTKGFYMKAKESFESLLDFQDAAFQAKECDRLDKQSIYDKAKQLMEEEKYLDAIKIFETILSFEDSKAQIAECKELKKEREYDKALSYKDNGQYDEAIQGFSALKDYKDSQAQVKDCEEKKELARKEKIYQESLVKEPIDEKRDYEKLKKGVQGLNSISGYKDSDKLVSHYQECISRAEKAFADKKKRKKKIATILIIALLSTAALVTGGTLMTTMYIIPSNRQSDIIKAINDGNYDRAQSLLKENGSYGESKKLTGMKNALFFFNSGDYESGIQAIYDVGGNVNVAYDGNGGNAPTNGTITKSRIKKAFINSKAEKDGYTFHGWVLKDYTMDCQNFSASISLQARYDTITYKISYDLDGGSVKGNPLTYDTENEEKLPTPTKEGYTFLGWTGSNGEIPEKEVTISHGTTGNLKYKANWQANTYTIHLSSTKGRLEKDTVSVVYGTQYTLPTPTYSGYDFQGWFDANGNEYSSGIYQYPGDLYLTDNATLVHYGIYYALGSDKVSVINPTSYTVQDNISLTNPTRSGFTFLGWTGSNGDVPQKNVTIPKGTTGNLTYKANWEGNTYTVILDSTLDVVPDSTIQAKNGTAYTLPTYDFGENGYEFAWFDGEKRIPITGTWDIPSDITLTGKKAPIEYKITYDLGGETNDSLNPSTYTIEDSVTLKAPTKPLHSFLGWTGSNGETPQKEVTIPKGTTGNLFYKANWELPTYSVGDTFTFGTYPQTSEGTDKTLISWKVLSVDSAIHEYLVVSEKVLDRVQFSSSSSSRIINGKTIYPNNYKYSTLRAWMNSYDGTSYSVSDYTGKGFIDTAFTMEEKAVIETSIVDNSASSTGYDSNPCACEDTNDKVFAPSCSEVTNSSYGFSSSGGRLAYATDYAKQKGVYVKGGARYLLRSPHYYYSDYTRFVNGNGSITSYDDISYAEYGPAGVRLALRIKLS